MTFTRRQLTILASIIGGILLLMLGTRAAWEAYTGEGPVDNYYRAVNPTKAGTVLYTQRVWFAVTPRQVIAVQGRQVYTYLLTASQQHGAACTTRTVAYNPDEATPPNGIAAGTPVRYATCAYPGLSIVINEVPPQVSDGAFTNVYKVGTWTTVFDVEVNRSR